MKDFTAWRTNYDKIYKEEGEKRVFLCRDALHVNKKVPEKRKTLT
jgi:hypothetical protein